MVSKNFGAQQTCANVVPEGSYFGPSVPSSTVQGTSRQDMTLKFGTQVKDVK
jgi:hypothetical protein